MNNLQFIASVSLYIISFAAALLLSIAKKNADFKKVKPFIVIHVILLAVFLVSLLFSLKNFQSYFFLFFFCSGIVTGGMIIRSRTMIWIKMYFSLYIISIFLFLISPSLLIKIITFNFDQSANNRKMHLSGNYFLEEEQSLMNIPDSMVHYKITQQFGVFHKTLARNIYFGSRIDSLKILSFDPRLEAGLRGYRTKKSATFEVPDSIDVFTRFDKPPENQIIHKKKIK